MCRFDRLSEGRWWKSVAVVLCVGAIASAHAASVQRFVPQGLDDRHTRATAVFSDPVVRLGQTDAPAPFNVDCGAVSGKGRWANANTWDYVIDRPLKPGERCDFTLKPGLKSIKGEAITGESRYEFFAPGPWPRSILPRGGQKIEEDQAFLIEPSAAVTRESVERNVWCEADGVGNRIPVRLLPDKTRAEMVASQGGKDSPALLALTCAERLPAGAHVRLVWGKGIETAATAGVASLAGVKSSRNENFAYVVREPFRASFSCTREKPNAPCSSLSEMRVDFSGTVDAKAAAAARLVGPDGKRSPQGQDNEGARESTVTAITFKPPFPQNSEFSLELPSDLKDDAGRVLQNAGNFPLKVRTGALPPLAKFAGSFGILELKEGGVLPVTLRNVEAKFPVANLRLPDANAHRFAEQRLTEDADVIAAIRKLAKFEQQTKRVMVDNGEDSFESEDIYYARELSFLAKKKGVVSRELPKPGGTAEFEVVGIPLEKPGFHIVEIESRLLGAALLSTPKPMYVRTTALVTNMAVHLKRGKDNGLVWVTTLDGGKPVPSAEVRVSGCDGKLYWQGRTDAQGRALFDVALPEQACQDDSFFFASARLGEDYSFVRSDWNEGIEPWRFGMETWGEISPRQIHTVLDRTLLRAGQTVSMKHIARDRNSRSFVFPDPKSLPTEIILQHQGSGEEFRQPLTWDKRGIAVSQWKIPESAKRGSYSIELRQAPTKQGDDGEGGRSYYTGEFRVSDFRLPVFSGSVQGVKDKLVSPKEVPLALGLSFLNGGAAKDAKVEVSSTVRPRWPEYKGYDGFHFIVDFEEEGRSAFAVGATSEDERLVADKVPVTLDKAGAGKVSIPLPERVTGPSELYSEMTFTDPNGEVQTLHGTVELSPAGVVAGIKVRDWASVTEKGAIEVVTLDTAGKPVGDVPVRVVAKRRVDYSHRKRIVGGFYAYENSTEFVDLGEICKGQSDARGRLVCEPQTDQPGNVYLLAEATDKQGNIFYAGTSYWVAGHGDLWFTAGNQDRIDVVPEKRSYMPGETARLQVRTPFREATALVSVEAGGVIDSLVVPLSRFNPVIDLPVKGEWGPNAFLSVLVVRGRVEPLKWYSFFSWGWREPIAWFKEWWNPALPTAMVDLAKPAYKVGLAAIDIGVDAFRLKVDVTPEKTDYAPHTTAKVKIKVTQPDGKPAPAGTEIAFAGVDQALLELRPNDSWNLLDAMLQKRAYQVETATAQSQVVGKRHYGKKALPPGGGGGRGPARELFDTLLLWNPRVALDANGTATLDVPLNDSLTEFKLVAIADAGVGLFGTGSASIRTKQDLQLISGLPPLVREHDKYKASLTVRNSTARAMTVEVKAKAGTQTLDAREVKLDAESATEIAWTAEAPEGETVLAWEFEATEKASGSAVASDKLRVAQQIAPAVPVTVQQATFARVEGALEVPVAVPTGAVLGKKGPRGGIEVGLSAKLSTPPPGLRRFFEEYPFSCLEQRTSVAVGLHDATRWQQIVESLPTYLDNNGLARYFPGDGRGNGGSPALTAYLLDLTQALDDDAFRIPPEIAQHMMRGLAAFAEGRIKPEYWSPQNDTVVRKLAAIGALVRRGQVPVSAIASLDIAPDRLPTSALIDWYDITRRLNTLPDRAARHADAERELRNRLSYVGSRLVFTSERSDYWWWLMVSGDVNAFRLIATTINDPAWKDDQPALVQGAMLRQQRGNWGTTVANAWATVALDQFGRKFEKDPVVGRTRVALGSVPVQDFSWPAKAGEVGTDNGGKLMMPWSEKPLATDALKITHEGSGKPWAALQVLAAVPVKEPIASGFHVTREVTPVEEKAAGKVSRGDVWRVHLTVESDQEMSWVVVNDPLPAGARVLGEGDGRDAQIATRGERTTGDAWPAYVERTFGAYRAYYAYVPRGKFAIDYTVRLSNAGEFVLPGARVEAMYAPEVFGAAPTGKVVVGE